jgi:hypothetical protein
MLAGYLKCGDCALLMTDSSTSADWLCKTNFWEIIGKDTDPVQAKVQIKRMQHHTTLFLVAGIEEYSHWFLGQENNVANTLLHNFDRTDNQLIQILHETCPSQLPQHFQIAPLPNNNKISLWLTSLLLKLPVKEQLREVHMRTMLGRGTVFSKYLGSIDIGNDLFLNSFTRSQQNKIIGAFAMALQQGQFLGPAHDTLALGTIQNTISDTSATFRENGQPNPTKDNNLQLSFILQCQFQAYKNAKPKEKQQKAIPTCIIAKIAKQQLTEL